MAMSDLMIPAPPWAESYMAVRELEDGLYLALIPMLFTLRVAVCDPSSIHEFWCYEKPTDAMVAFWGYPDDEPTGWTRHHARGGVDEHPV